jgi:hypothetical protein
VITHRGHALIDRDGQQFRVHYLLKENSQGRVTGRLTPQPTTSIALQALTNRGPQDQITAALQGGRRFRFSVIGVDANGVEVDGRLLGDS